MFDDLIKSSLQQPQYLSTFLDGTVVYFRLLTLKEYKAIASLKDTVNIGENEFFEFIYNLCCAPEFKNLGGRIKAGIPESIGKFIYTQSFSYENIEQEIEMARAQYDSNEIYEQMKFLIHRHLKYDFPYLDNITRPELIKLFIRAEYIAQIDTNGEYKPLNTKSMRQKANSSNINFDQENKELNREFGNGSSDPTERNRPAMEVQQIREAASIRAQNRKNKK